ncbi:MAG: hypothetical protein RLZZ387_426 [Chloroflexota bacterium]|jgi:hypothetical protein
MHTLSQEQIRGLADLALDALAAGVDVTETTHAAIARQPFEVMERAGLALPPVLLVERIERSVRGQVYNSLRAAHRAAAALNDAAWRLL